MPAIRGVVFSLFGTLLADARPDAETPPSPPTRLAPTRGAADVIQSCYGRFRLAVVSTDEAATASEIWGLLAELDWHRYFETISAAPDLDTSAGAPGLYRAAASSLGIQPGSLVVVCSARIDEVLGANAAGCWPIRIGGDSAGEPVPELADDRLSRLDRRHEDAESLAALPAALDAVRAR